MLSPINFASELSVRKMQAGHFASASVRNLFKTLKSRSNLKAETSTGAAPPAGLPRPAARAPAAHRYSGASPKYPCPPRGI